MPKNLTNQTQTGMQYIGDGSFMQGVPARDLTADEWKALDANTQALCLDLNLYKPIIKTDPAPEQQSQAEPTKE